MPIYSRTRSQNRPDQNRAVRVIQGGLPLLLVAACLLAGPALAQSTAAPHNHSTERHDHSHAHPHVLPQHQLTAADFDEAPDDLVLWGQLAKTGLIREGHRYTARFLPPVLALEGKTISLIGFMAPVHPGEREKQFLLSEIRFLCNECQSAPGPLSIVEVNAQEAEPVRDRPITVRGTLELVRNNPDGLVYRLNDATVLQH